MSYGHIAIGRERYLHKSLVLCINLLVFGKYLGDVFAIHDSKRTLVVKLHPTFVSAVTIRVAKEISLGIIPLWITHSHVGIVPINVHGIGVVRRCLEVDSVLRIVGQRLECRRL